MQKMGAETSAPARIACDRGRTARPRAVDFKKYSAYTRKYMVE
jgi:hypothetical protein